MAWYTPVVAPTLVTTATFGSRGSMNIICILILAFGLGAFGIGFGSGFGAGLGIGFGTRLDGPSVWA